MTTRRAEARSRRFGSWRRTAAWYRAPGLVALGASVGLAAGRPDLVLLVAPIAIGWILALLSTIPLLGARAPVAAAIVDAASFGGNSAEVVTEVVGTDGVELATALQPAVDRGPLGAAVTVSGGAPSRVVRSRFRTSQWGRTAVTRPDSLGAGPDGLYVSGPVRYAPARTELILPAVAAIPAIELPPLNGGWAGAHVSRRPGQGSDLVDLREFAPGDRLRQVHWRAYARLGRLYTRRTLSDAEAELMICLDLARFYRPRLRPPAVGLPATLVARGAALASRIGDGISRWRDPARFARILAARRGSRLTSLDHAVAAAAAVAAAHLRQGDRVGLMAATVPRRLLRPGTGDRQLQRIRCDLALSDDRRWRPLPVSLWGLTPGQIVVWCSPMTTAAAFSAVAECAARGHRVVVIDTLPLDGMITHGTAADLDHLRLLAAERERDLARLRARGIGVVHWPQGDIDGQLVEVARVLRGRR